MHKEFLVHKLTDDGIALAKEIADAFDYLLSHLEEMVPEGRELSIVRTKLEEASFFAKKGMAPFYVV